MKKLNKATNLVIAFIHWTIIRLSLCRKDIEPWKFKS